ncbi:MAG: antitoxin VapB family protein [Candidatus Aenigmatarchaeota archaeon]
MIIIPTTVQVSEETKKRLEEEKDYSRESYDEVIRELIDERESRLKKKIEKAKKQEGVPHEKVKEVLGIE